MSKHKYLEEIGVRPLSEESITTCYNKRYYLKHPLRYICDLIASKRERNQSYKLYGFNIKDTWYLENAFYMWLYERLRAFLDVAGKKIDLTYFKFTYEEKEYTQEELTKLLISKLEVMIKICEDFIEDEPGLYTSLRKEICDIWCILLPVTWW